MIGSAPSFWGTKYFEEKPNYHLTPDAPNEMKKEFEEFFSDWDLGQSKHKEMKNPVYTWEGKIVDKSQEKRNDAVECYRKRREERLNSRGDNEKDRVR